MPARNVGSYSFSTSSAGWELPQDSQILNGLGLVEWQNAHEKKSERLSSLRPFRFLAVSLMRAASPILARNTRPPGSGGAGNAP